MIVFCSNRVVRCHFKSNAKKDAITRKYSKKLVEVRQETLERTTKVLSVFNSYTRHDNVHKVF